MVARALVVVAAGVVWERVKCLLLGSLEDVVVAVVIVVVEVVLKGGVVTVRSTSRVKRKMESEFWWQIAILAKLERLCFISC